MDIPAISVSVIGPESKKITTSGDKMARSSRASTQVSLKAGQRRDGGSVPAANLDKAFLDVNWWNV